MNYTVHIGNTYLLIKLDVDRIFIRLFICLFYRIIAKKINSKERKNSTKQSNKLSMDAHTLARTLISSVELRERIKPGTMIVVTEIKKVMV